DRHGALRWQLLRRHEDSFAGGGGRIRIMAWVWNKRKLANDQKIAAFGSSYRERIPNVGAAKGCDLLLLFDC
ncbi:hypothetical protein, partial [Pseudomonas fluorescens]|uniref:hypothetical protein n=1 Tax=Pseudomonas fluorescens TaxID=294 RepID=UPI001CD3C0FC